MQGLGSTWSSSSSFINIPEKALGIQETFVNQKSPEEYSDPFHQSIAMTEELISTNLEVQ